MKQHHVVRAVVIMAVTGVMSLGVTAAASASSKTDSVAFNGHTLTVKEYYAVDIDSVAVTKHTATFSSGSADVHIRVQKKYRYGSTELWVDAAVGQLRVTSSSTTTYDWSPNVFVNLYTVPEYGTKVWTYIKWGSNPEVRLDGLNILAGLIV